MKRSYWLQLAGCVVFLLLPGASVVRGRWYDALPRPWNGIIEIVTAFADAASPFVFIYLFVLAKKLG